MIALLKKKWLLAVGLIVIAAVAAGVYWVPAMTRSKAPAFRLDVSAPDALLLSQNLSELPRDLLQVPLLRETFTEDLVFYYEQHEDRLSLSGTLKRLAFEHEVSFSDELINALLQQPAEVALWKGPGGKLEHWLLAVRRGGLTRVAEAALKLADKDGQLQKAGELTLAGRAVPVYVLNYGRGQHLFFSAQGERLLAATDAQLLLGSSAENSSEADARLQLVQQLIQGDAASNPFVRQFRLDAHAARHSLTLTTRYLSLGYGQLFRGVNALRFDFGQGQWSSWGQLDATRIQAEQLDARALWQKAPTGAALCATAPVDWPLLQKTLAELTDDAAQAARFTASLQAPAAVCWYAAGHYHAPLFLVAGDAQAWPDGWLQALFNAFIRTPEGAAPLQARKLGAATVWQRQLAGQTNTDNQNKTSNQNRTDNQNKPGSRATLARHQGLLLFSTDAALVERALQVAERRYPALADGLPAKPGSVALYVHPAELARLLRADVMASLPEESEPVFHEAASSRLLPRLRALEKYPPFVLRYPQRLRSSSGWEPLQWAELQR